jgi:hypothetical protein
MGYSCTKDASDMLGLIRHTFSDGTTINGLKIAGRRGGSSVLASTLWVARFTPSTYSTPPSLTTGSIMPVVTKFFSTNFDARLMPL